MNAILFRSGQPENAKLDHLSRAFQADPPDARGFLVESVSVPSL